MSDNLHQLPLAVQLARRFNELGHDKLEPIGRQLLGLDTFIEHSRRLRQQFYQRGFILVIRQNQTRVMLVPPESIDRSVFRN